MSMQNLQPDPDSHATLPWWRRLLQPPTSLADLADQRQSQLLLGLGLTFFFTSVLGAIAGNSFVELMLLAAGVLVSVILSRTRYYQFGSGLIIAFLTGITFIRTANDVEASLFFMPLTFLLASVLLPHRYAATAILVNMVGLLLLPLASTIEYADLAQYAGVIFVLGLLFIYTTFFRDSLERDRFNLLTDTNKSLEALRTDLDKQVQARTAELALAADVGRSLSQVRSLDELLQDAAELIRERFDLYYVQIYLTDSAQSKLVLRAGTGQVAKDLIKRRHALSIVSNSINGSAALTKQPVIVPNTRENSLFKPNLLLPNTRSELAIPLIIGDRVLGVLDLQSTAPNSLSESILPVFDSIASQLAISIDNANLFTAASEAQAEAEAYLKRIAGEGWSTYLDGLNRQERLSYVYDIMGEVTDLAEGAPFADKSRKNSLNLPIVVANEPIGSIQLEAGVDQQWTASSRNIVDAVAQQVAQQLENLRLLDEAQQYRLEAESALRRLSREMWQLTQDDVALPGFVYDGTQVKPLADTEMLDSSAENVASLPLEVQGEEIGKIMLAGVPEMNADMNALVANVSQYLSRHLERLYLTQQTEEALNTTARLYQIGGALNAANNVQEILEASVEPVKQGLRESTLMFVELDEQGEPQSLEVLADWRPTGKPSFPIGTRFLLSQFPFTQLFLSHPYEPQFIEDIANAAQVDENTQNIMRQVGIRAIIVVPLTISGQWVGLMTFSWATPQTFSHQLREYFTALINMAAPVVQSQRLYARARGQAEKERLINVINQQIQGTFSVESALQTAVLELGKALNASNAVVQLGQPKEETKQTVTNGSNGRVTA